MDIINTGDDTIKKQILNSSDNKIVVDLIAKLKADEVTSRGSIGHYLESMECKPEINMKMFTTNVSTNGVQEAITVLEMLKNNESAEKPIGVSNPREIHDTMNRLLPMLEAIKDRLSGDMDQSKLDEIINKEYTYAWDKEGNCTVDLSKENIISFINYGEDNFSIFNSFDKSMMNELRAVILDKGIDLSSFTILHGLLLLNQGLVSLKDVDKVKMEVVTLTSMHNIFTNRLALINNIDLLMTELKETHMYLARGLELPYNTRYNLSAIKSLDSMLTNDFLTIRILDLFKNYINRDK